MLRCGLRCRHPGCDAGTSTPVQTPGSVKQHATARLAPTAATKRSARALASTVKDARVTTSSKRRRSLSIYRAQLQPSQGHTEPDIGGDDGFEGLLPEEDWVVAGGPSDSLTSNTQLGRAVQEACDELDTLAALEKGTLDQAQELLAKMGYKGSLYKAATEPLQD